MSRACSMACLNMSEYVWCLNVQTFSWQQDATSYASYATSFNKICQDLCVVEVTVCCWERSRGRSWMRLWRSRCGRDVLRNMTSRDSKKWSDEIKRFKYILIWFKLRVIWCQDLFFSPSGADLFKSIVFLCQIICVFMGKASQTDKYTDIHCYIIIWYYIYTQLCIFIYIIYIVYIYIAIHLNMPGMWITAWQGWQGHSFLCILCFLWEPPLSHSAGAPHDAQVEEGWLNLLSSHKRHKAQRSRENAREMLQMLPA